MVMRDSFFKLDDSTFIGLFSKKCSVSGLKSEVYNKYSQIVENISTENIE